MMRAAICGVLLSLLGCVVAGGAEPIFDSGVITGKTPGRGIGIDVPLGGSDRVYLVANDAGDGSSCDWAAWLEPRFVGAGGEQRLTDLKPREATTGWGKVYVGKNASGGDLVIGGKKFEDGIGVHANSVLEYRVPKGGAYDRFVAKAGLDDGGVGRANGAAASVRFQVFTEDPRGGGAGDKAVPTSLFSVPEGLEVTIWARSPLLNNPTNIDVDRDGRIWVAEGVNYRRHAGRRAEGDRIVVLEDSDGDGRADSSQVFVQEKFLAAPLGVAVFDNQIVVSMTPSMIVYTDVDRNRKFDAAIDKREVLLTGFNKPQHDHTLHSVTAGPGGDWYWNAGNCGGMFTDKSGQTFRISGAYERQPYAGQPSDDGHVYVGGFTARMRPDGSRVRIVGHNYRNSYEQTVTSFGDVFQNDNDDPPACRVSFVMEYGNAGFSSFDGTRSWQADRRPGQDIPTAQWRQEDPGTMPAGDIYGGGSPTGVAFYENGSLGEAFEGMLLSCEAGRNVVFGYQPELDGAGFKMERNDFLTSNASGEFAGSDFLGGGKSVRDDLKTFFRPSDVVVGADGALYVSDWFDPRVGGHQDLDESLSGAIYRVAPQGFKPVVPSFDLDTIPGQVAALRSPAVNVRNLGFVRLRGQGGEAIDAVAELLEDESRFIRARAIWLLAQMGDAGIAKVRALSRADDEAVRTVVFRALRRVVEEAPGRLAALVRQTMRDPSPAVRREVMLAMRGLSWEESGDVLLAGYELLDAVDRHALEALGTGATNKETEFFEELRKREGGVGAMDWAEKMARVVWRLKVPAAVSDLKVRAMSRALTSQQRRLAIDSLAFIKTKEAADAMLAVAEDPDDPLRDQVIWWLFNRNGNEWRDYGVLEGMKELGVYDPGSIEFVSITVPDPKDLEVRYPSVEAIVAMEADPKRGEVAAARCLMCHVIGDSGIDYGPALSDFGKTQPASVIAASMTSPSSSISHGYQGWVVVTDDGAEIHGLLIADGDPLIVKSVGGKTQTIPKSRVKSKRKLGRSLMMSAGQLGMSAQDVADVTVYLKNLETE